MSDHGIQVAEELLVKYKAEISEIDGEISKLKKRRAELIEGCDLLCTIMEKEVLDTVVSKPRAKRSTASDSQPLSIQSNPLEANSLETMSLETKSLPDPKQSVKIYHLPS